MMSWLGSFGRSVSIGLLMTTAAQAQNAHEIIESFRDGEFSIDGPSLERFAIEWHRLAGEVMATGDIPRPDQYQALRNFDQNMIGDVLSAFADNGRLVEFLDSEEALDAFNRIYQRGISEGSIVGNMSQEEAAGNFILSGSIFAGEDTPGTVVYWCLPPIIGCGPWDDSDDDFENGSEE